MKNTMRSWVLGATVTALAAGCGLNGSAPGAPFASMSFALEPGAEMTPAQADAFFARASAEAKKALPATSYGVLETGEQELGVQEVTASSVRNDYFRLAYVTDGNTHSAWGPTATDAAPSLTFTLNDTYRLSGMVVKVSPVGVTLDVAIADADGTWQTIAAGLTPAEYEAMSRVELPGADARQVKVSFHGVASKDLLVCEVHWFGQPAPAPTPTPTATPTPTPVPTSTPTPVPTPTPTDCGFGLKGVGILSGGCPPTTFAFEAANVPGRGVSGFVYVLMRGKLLMGKVNVLQQQNRTVTLSGTLTNGDAFTLVADENGSRDVVSFSTEDRLDFSGTVRCGDVKFTALPCDMPTVKTPCKVHHWGKCFTREYRSDKHKHGDKSIRFKKDKEQDRRCWKWHR